MLGFRVPNSCSVHAVMDPHTRIACTARCPVHAVWWAHTWPSEHAYHVLDTCAHVVHAGETVGTDGVCGPRTVHRLLAAVTDHGQPPGACLLACARGLQGAEAEYTTQPPCARRSMLPMHPAHACVGWVRSWPARPALPGFAWGLAHAASTCLNPCSIQHTPRTRHYAVWVGHRWRVQVVECDLIHPAEPILQSEGLCLLPGAWLCMCVCAGVCVCVCMCVLHCAAVCVFVCM